MLLTAITDLPHNGVATIDQFIEATNSVYGMGLDLAGFLTVYGAVFDGDLLSWSIGGAPPASLLSPLGSLIGEPTGLTGSHNKYENDASPGRGDLYLTGDNHNLNKQNFGGLYALQAQETEETSNYNLDILTSWRATRHQQSIDTNPYFFNGIFSGLLVHAAAYTFIYRFMANHSEEYPEGRLSQNVLKSFFAVSGANQMQGVYTPGYERIPDNWYKRAIGDEYTIPFFLSDVLSAAEQHPEFLEVGGNIGTVNSFTGVDVSNITGGVFDTTTLLEGNNLGCFAFQLIVQSAPDILQGLISDVAQATQQLTQAIDAASTGLNCPQLDSVDRQNLENNFGIYPGVTQLQDDGTYDPDAEPSLSNALGGLTGGIL